MKKILSPKIKGWNAAGLAAKLKHLVEADPEIAAERGEITVRGAWALSGDRVKIQVEVQRPDRSYRLFTRTVAFPLPPELKLSYRDWTIVIAPTWYGFGWRVFDESGAATGESSEDVDETDYAIKYAEREVDRQLGERAVRELQAAKASDTKTTRGRKAPPPSTSLSPTPQRALATKAVAPRTSEPKVNILPASLPVRAAEVSTVYSAAQSDKPIVRKEAPSIPLPALISEAGDKARWRFIEFFVASIRNKHTRRAYYNAVTQFFNWLDQRGVRSLGQITPSIVGAYIEQHPGDKPTVKQHLAAIRGLFDWLVVGQVIPTNPASSVRGPKYVVKKGKTPVLTPDQARQLLDSIDTGELIGLRDRAIIGVMVYSFARVGAVTSMRVEDYFQSGKKWRFRLHEKGGKLHEVPAHHTAEEYIDSYLDAAGLWDEKKAPLFQSIKHGKARGKKLAQPDVYRMIRKRALEAGLGVDVCCHTWRATGITAYLLNGGSLETAQAIANHESPRTTKLYDRTGDEITLDEVERIRI